MAGAGGSPGPCRAWCLGAIAGRHSATAEPGQVRSGRRLPGGWPAGGMLMMTPPVMTGWPGGGALSEHTCRRQTYHARAGLITSH